MAKPSASKRPAPQAKQTPRIAGFTDSRETPDSPEYRERVYQIVRRIPRGRVMTYGQIAIILGQGYTPRTVGYVMHAAAEENVPWQRVINAQGACSTGRLVLPPDKQQRMLEAEGVVFNEKGRCDLGTFRWEPPEYARADEVEEQPTLFRK
jgi:methylated-DNA-protein-cysteine methyltransferase-like protein